MGPLFHALPIAIQIPRRLESLKRTSSYEYALDVNTVTKEDTKHLNVYALWPAYKWQSTARRVPKLPSTFLQAPSYTELLSDSQRLYPWYYTSQRCFPVILYLLRLLGKYAIELL